MGFENECKRHHEGLLLFEHPNKGMRKLKRTRLLSRRNANRLEKLIGGCLLRFYGELHRSFTHWVLQATTSTLLESEDLFNSSYVPNNPGGLILDTALWKNTESNSHQESSPLVHLQPILVEQNSSTNEENFFLAPDEGTFLSY